MHARRFDVTQGRDSPAELSLEGALKTRRFHRLAGAEALVLLQDLEPHGIALRQAVLGELHTRVVQFVAGDHHGAGFGVDLERNTRFLQGLDDLAGILARKVRV